MWHSICWEPGWKIGYIPLETPVTTWDVRHWPSGMHMQLAQMTKFGQNSMPSKISWCTSFTKPLSLATPNFDPEPAQARNEYEDPEKNEDTPPRRGICLHCFLMSVGENAAGQIAPRSKWFFNLHGFEQLPTNMFEDGCHVPCRLHSHLDPGDKHSPNRG